MYIPNYLSRIAPSDIVRTAHVGVGGMGTQHLKWFAALPESQIAAICDVDQKHITEAIKLLKEIQPDRKISTYTDFRKLLERSDIDAISCATPDHWHASIAIKAFEAGKDVYGEKPLSYTDREGQKMLKSQLRNEQIFQLGTQIHAGDNYHRVVEIIQSGKLGNIHTVKLWKTGPPPVFPSLTKESPPASLNWDMWQGPAPSRDYAKERCHFTYRYFMDYSGGVFADFWCHIADVVFWALNPSGLKSIDARGKKSAGVGDTPEWIDVDYEFEDLNILWTTNPPEVPGVADMSIGAHFIGEKGTLTCNYGSKVIRFAGEELEDIKEVAQSINRSPGHQQNFIDSIKSRRQPQSNLAYARKMTLPMHLGLISWQLERKLQWDDAKEKFVGDSQANKMLKRKARKPWKMI
jgi:predicted dehydrogenase